MVSRNIYVNDIPTNLRWRWQIGVETMFFNYWNSLSDTKIYNISEKKFPYAFINILFNIIKLPLLYFLCVTIYQWKNIYCVILELPPVPRIQIIDNTHTSVIAKWDIDNFSGNFQVFLPYNIVKKMSKSFYKMENLEPNTKYNITVIAENDVTKKTGRVLKDIETFWTSSKGKAYKNNIKYKKIVNFWNKARFSYTLWLL